MERKYKIGATEMVHYFQPGLLCDDITVKRIHKALVTINERSGTNVVNKILNKENTLEEIRSDLRDIVIAIGFMNNEPCGFLISPILSPIGKRSIVHAGLVIIAKNPGVSFIDLMAFGNYCMAYEKLGKFYASNITSTPSIVETFDSMASDAWPSPKAKLKVAPKAYKEVIKKLKNEYMDKNFPNPEKLEIDYRRFILTSNSQEMGFTTDFRKIARSDDAKYLVFCHAWVDYAKEEDIIQVGEVRLYTYLRMKYLAFVIKRKLKKAEAERDQEQKTSQQNKVNEEKKAA